MTLQPIDTDSAPGSWRSALEPGRSCKVCCQKICGHSDLEYAGLVPPRPAAEPVDG